MTKYYVSEAGCPWEPTNAQTLASAKRAARLMHTSKGVQVHPLIGALRVGIKLEGGNYRTISRLIVDALDMSDKGYWYDT